MLQILYVCDKVLSPLDRIAVLGTNHSTVYSWGYVFPLESFIISMLTYIALWRNGVYAIQFESCTYVV